MSINEHKLLCFKDIHETKEVKKGVKLPMYCIINSQSKPDPITLDPLKILPFVISGF